MQAARLETRRFSPNQKFDSGQKIPKTQNEAFGFNYDKAVTHKELRRDTISYLCEYRLQVPKYQYELIFGRDKNNSGNIALRDIDRGESLDRIAERAIDKKNRLNSPALREKAEKTGLESLQKQLSSAETGDMILWASPPGPKEEGYGDYGFLYAGKITKRNNGEAHIAMSAIRINRPSLTQYNNALKELSNDNVAHLNDIGFLANPRIVQKGIGSGDIDRVLKKHFSFTPDDEVQKKSSAIIKQMMPMIDDFIGIVRTGTDAEKRQALNALENYALAKKEERTEEAGHHQSPRPTIIYEQPVHLNQILEKYGHKPPEIRGSCGATGSSSNGLTSMKGEVSKSIYGSDKYGDRAFECPSCHKMNIRPANEMLSNCQFCESKEVAC